MRGHRLSTETLLPNQVTQVASGEDAIYNIQMAGEEVYVSTQTSLQIYRRTPFGDGLVKEFSRPFYYLRWTMTDLDLSLQEDRLVHSSLNSRLGLFCLSSRSYLQMLDLSPEPEEQLRVSSVKFSRDGTQVLCGSQVVESQPYVVVFDIEKEKREVAQAGQQDINSLVHLQRHSDDSLFLTGDDDGSILLWDQRTLSRPVGQFLGHHSGISHVASREDGRYFASNAKDNTCKLWDMRRQLSWQKKYNRSMVLLDYRFQMLAESTQDHLDRVLQARLYHQNHQDIQARQRVSAEDLADMTQLRLSHTDVSLQTFKGHSVLLTLIRCHFGPGGHTLYSGSALGGLPFWDIRTDRTLTTLGRHDLTFSRENVVRDLKWHGPTNTVLVGDLGGNLFQWRYSAGSL